MTTVTTLHGVRTEHGFKCSTPIHTLYKQKDIERYMSYLDFSIANYITNKPNTLGIVGVETMSDSIYRFSREYYFDTRENLTKFMML